jgi:hypothetical protein
MTTYAPHDTTREARVRDAWTAYRDRLVSLEGAEYDAAEQESWERLQGALREIDQEHAAVPEGGGPAGA